MNSNARDHCRLQLLKGQHILDLVRQHFCVSHATPEQHGSDDAGDDDGDAMVAVLVALMVFGYTMHA